MLCTARLKEYKFRQSFERVLLKILFLVFIVTPILEIALFMQVGGLIGLVPTLIMILLTAIIGVNLLKSQGISVWHDIQSQLGQGQVPAVAMISGAQLLFAGGLLLTPGFLTDTIGFLLLVPQVRRAVAMQMIKHWQVRAAGVNGANFYSETQYSHSPFTNQNSNPSNRGRIIEGEYEKPSQEK